MLADGAVVEAGPLRESERFARLLATGGTGPADGAVPVGFAPGSGGGRRAGGVALAEARPEPATDIRAPARTDPPPVPEPARARSLRQIGRLVLNDPRYGLGAIGVFLGIVLLGLDGAVLPWLWANLVDGSGSLVWPAVGITAGLLVTAPLPYFASRWFPEWWVRQMLRISLRLVHGQTGPRRVSAHTPAEVVAQGGDTERVVMLADNVIDQFISIIVVVTMTLVAGTFVPALFFVGTMVASGAAATLFGRCWPGPLAGPWPPGPRSRPRWCPRSPPPGR